MLVPDKRAYNKLFDVSSEDVRADNISTPGAKISTH